MIPPGAPKQRLSVGRDQHGSLMGLMGHFTKTLFKNWSGKRTWTPDEIRALITERQLDEASEALPFLNATLADFDAEKDCLQGEILYHQRRDKEAEECFRSALRAVPGMPQGHYGLSLILSERRQFGAAARHAQFAINVKKEGRYYAQLGYCHLMLGNIRAAETPLRLATLLNADSPSAWNNLGIALLSKRAGAEARLCFERALRLNPAFEAAREHLLQLEKVLESGAIRQGTTDNPLEALAAQPALPHPDLAAALALEEEGLLQQAIDACEALLLMHDDESISLCLARLYERASDVDSALDTLRAYREVHPEAQCTIGALGLLLLRVKQFDAAEPLLRQALETAPEHIDYLVGLASTLTGKERYTEAASFIDKAVAINPDEHRLIGLKAANLSNRCLYDEALVLVQTLKENGFSINSHSMTLGYLGRIDEALALINEQIQRQPNDPNLRFQRAQLNLLLGNYEQGWEDYDVRGLAYTRNFRMLPFPVWADEPLEGKQLIVLAEQGLGDQVMFASCLNDLLQLHAGKVILEAHNRVATTLARSFPQCQVIATGQKSDLEWAKEFPETDFFVHLADLPRRFRPNLESFPRHSGYLHPDPERVIYWREQLAARGPGPYLGISWRGGTEQTRKVLRSLEPEQLIPLAERPATWVCLQYGAAQEDVDRMKSGPMPLQYWPEAIANLDEFAALISAMDGVLSVCNTTVHFAGALGKPVWVLAPRVPEWRYGLNNEVMPWYPSSLVFRQTRDGDWSAPIEQMCQKLSHHSFGMGMPLRENGINSHL